MHVVQSCDLHESLGMRLVLDSGVLVLQRETRTSMNPVMLPAGRDIL
jgi:hypothetical protein